MKSTTVLLFLCTTLVTVDESYGNIRCYHCGSLNRVDVNCADPLDKDSTGTLSCSGSCITYSRTTNSTTYIRRNCSPGTKEDACKVLSVEGYDDVRQCFCTGEKCNSEACTEKTCNTAISCHASMTALIVCALLWVLYG